jgi:recombinational DNA repair protein (RecF pathway)
MPALAQTIEGTILNRVETGESYLRISLFSGENGLSLVLLRIYKRSRSVPPPDLFDDVEFNVDNPRSGSGLPFVRDFQIIKKRAKVAHHHLRFQIASSLALLFLDNGYHLQDTMPVYQLLLNALSALEDGLDPMTIWLKTLFRFGRIEGLPVKQDWLANLNRDENQFAIFTLNTPVAEQETKPDKVLNLVHSLRSWLNAETELRC